MNNIQDKDVLWIRHQKLYRLLTGVLDGYICRKLNYTYEDFDPGSIEGPLIIIPNHACAWDPLLIGAAMKKRQMYFVASEHLLRKKIAGPLINYLAGPIPRKKASTGTGTVMSCLRHLRAGHSICLFAEGEQSWNGISRPVFPATGKMVRQSGATLITYRLEGAFLSLPRWARGVRRGRVYGHPVGIYPPEELKKMKPEEINALIDRDICFDIREWQAQQPGGPVQFRLKGSKRGLAEKLEKAVFSCPACGRIGTLVSSGDEIGCECGFRVRFTDTGSFDPPEPVGSIVEWEELDRQNVASLTEKAYGKTENTTLFSDSAATLTGIIGGHSEKPLDEGRLSVEFERGIPLLRVGEHSFPLREIRDMAQVLSNILLLYDGEQYCQIYSEEANLRKYYYAWEIINK